jgi:hypothetical protein
MWDDVSCYGSMKLSSKCLQRYTLIDHRCLKDLLRISSMDILRSSHRSWVVESLRIEGCARDSWWSKSIAVGNKGFVAMVKRQLSMRAKGRKIIEPARECRLRETQFPYRGISGDENSPLRSQNMQYWDVYPVRLDG